jgi:hypothetical protein
VYIKINNDWVKLTDFEYPELIAYNEVQGSAVGEKSIVLNINEADFYQKLQRVFKTNLREINTELKAAVISSSTGMVDQLSRVVPLTIVSMAPVSDWCAQVYPTFESEAHTVLPTNVDETFDPIKTRFTVATVSDFCQPVFTLQVLNPFTQQYDNVLGLQQ